MPGSCLGDNGNCHSRHHRRTALCSTREPRPAVRSYSLLWPRHRTEARLTPLLRPPSLLCFPGYRSPHRQASVPASCLGFAPPFPRQVSVAQSHCRPALLQPRPPPCWPRRSKAVGCSWAHSLRPAASLLAHQGPWCSPAARSCFCCFLPPPTSRIPSALPPTAAVAPAGHDREPWPSARSIPPPVVDRPLLHVPELSSGAHLLPPRSGSCRAPPGPLSSSRPAPPFPASSSPRRSSL